MRVNNFFVVDNIQSIPPKKYDDKEGRNSRKLLQNMRKKKGSAMPIRVEISGRTLNHESENTNKL